MRTVAIAGLVLFAVVQTLSARRTMPAPQVFSIAIEHTDSSWAATCSKGCVWEAASLTCPGGCAVIVDDSGMHTVAAGRSKDEKFAFVISSQRNEWQAHAYSGARWITLRYACERFRCKPTISEFGVSDF